MIQGKRPLFTHCQLRYNWNGKANFQPFRDGWHHGHPPWFLGVQSQKQGGGDFQDKRDTLNSELDALEARRFMLPPLGSHPRPHGPKPKWPSAGTHGVPGAVPGAAGSPHSVGILSICSARSAVEAVGHRADF